MVWWLEFKDIQEKWQREWVKNKSESEPH
jgi:hypothetical protein